MARSIPIESYQLFQSVTPHLESSTWCNSFNPNSLSVACNAVARLFEDAEPVRKFKYSNGVVGYLFRRDGTLTAALWNYTERRGIRADLSRFRVMDLFGNPLEQTGPVFSVTEEPSYLRIASADADGVAAAIERASLKVRKAPAKLESLAGEEKPRIPKLPDFVAPSENPAGVFQLDLRRFCNMGLADDASGNGRGGWSD